MNLGATRRMLVAMLAGAILGPSASFAAWPPSSDATESQVVESLFREVRRRAVADPDPVKRAWAWWGLGSLDPTALVELVGRGLTDPDPLVRREALSALRGFTDALAAEPQHTHAIRQAIAVGLHDADAGVRREAAYIVVYFLDLDWTGVGLEHALLDADREVRQSCFRALRANHFRGFGLGADLVPTLARVVGCSQDEVQLDAIEWLTEFAEHETDSLGPAVAAGLASASPNVRIAAKLAGESKSLRQWKRDELLAWALADRDPRVRQWAFDQGLAGDRAALERGASDPDLGVARAALASAEALTPVLDIDPLAVRRRAQAPQSLRDHAELDLIAEFAWRRRQRRSRWWGGLDYAQRTLAAFRRAVPESEERRLAAMLLREFTARTVLDAPSLTGRTFDESLAGWGDAAVRLAAWPLVIEVHNEFVAALDDPDPIVRCAACRAIACVDGNVWFGRPPRRTWGDDWRRVLAKIEDPNPGVRRIVAAILEGTARALERDGDHETLKIVDATVRRALGDSDKAVALTAAFAASRSAPGREERAGWWNDQAAQALLGLSRDEQQAYWDDRRPGAVSLRATRALFRRAPELLPRELIVAAALDRAPTVASERIPILARHWNDRTADDAVAAALQVGALDELLTGASAAEHADHRDFAHRLLSVHSRSSRRLTPDEVRQVAVCLERHGGAPSVFLLHAVRSLCDHNESMRRTVERWAADAAGQGGVHYAALRTQPAIASGATLHALGSDDALACCLAFAALATSDSAPDLSAALKGDDVRRRALAAAVAEVRRRSAHAGGRVRHRIRYELNL